MSEANYSKNASADKFYTDPDVAKSLVETLDLDKFDLIIEPSAGSWAFGRWLPKHKSFCFDLFPDEEWPDTLQQDYLLFNLENFILEKNAKNVLIIGNPPFGRLSGLATKFVQKSCISNRLLDIQTTVAFVLSETFGKVSFAARIPTTHTLTTHVNVGSPFTVDGQPYDKLNCGWFVWSPIPREKEVRKISSDVIKFHSKEEWLKLPNENKCAIRGQGSGAGQVFWGKDAEDKLASTTRFCSGVGVHVLEQIDWTTHKNMTVGIPSISLVEIVLEVETKMQQNRK